MSAPRSWHPDGVALAVTGPGQHPPLLPARIASGALELDLTPETLFLATEVARLASADQTEREAALLLALAVLAAERQGSTRIAVAAESLAPILEALGGAPEAIDLALRRAADPPLGTAWLGRPGEYRPLVSDGRFLTSQRLAATESRVAASLRDRFQLPSEPGGAALDAILEAIRNSPPLLPGGVPVLLSSEQEHAVRRVLERPFSLVTGGPGTGKTSVVVSILRARARWRPWSPQAVALAAPTGRAADRLRSSLSRFLDAIPDPPRPDRQLREHLPAAFTLHRLLGYSPRSGRFLHHEHHPLPQELVVVDESSMVDLALMDRLLRSVGPDAHLVLLGDADQLPSVDAGAVFRDLCRTPALSAGEATVRLTHSYRMDAEDSSGRAILAAARRVRSGEPLRPGIDFVERARVEDVALRGVELLPAGRQRRVAWWERWMRSLPEPEQVAGRAFERTADGEWRLEDHQVLSALLDALESARILTAHRGYAGGTGATAVNLWFHERHARAAGAGSRANLLPGEPVLVTRNDYRRNLFNGDQGAIVRVAEVTGEARLHALFRLEGALRTFALESLGGGLELSWATTVHKAQGSEMERVTLVLPDLPSRILDRDLVYTAVTRARRSVVLLGSATVLREAAARKLDRSTGLADLLDDPRSEPTAPGTQLDLPWAKGQS